ncbi:MAG: MFS transporter [Armatimonadota bacterium]|nr:MFS transporter [Armatimonadota bacterium]
MRLRTQKAGVPRSVVALGAVSLMNDVSSEMVYPLLPLFLRGLGASPAFIGLVEGLAETTASLLKLYSGWLADRLGKHRALAFVGYLIAALTRPLLALANAPWQVLSARVIDRLGKGIRVAPRDALIAVATLPAQRGLAFGFHRAMDNLGAAIGPALASLLLVVAHENYRLVFWVAAVPALLSLGVFWWGVRAIEVPPRQQTRSPLAGARTLLQGRFRRYLLCVLVFTLGNSSDAFLLLRAQEVGVAAAAIPLLWMGLNLLRSAAGVYGGALADRYGRLTVLRWGWLAYALVYAGFGFASTVWQMVPLFALYALFYALTEGAERALVADFVPAERSGQAYGLYHFTVGLAALPASALFGWLWGMFGAPAAFATGAILALLATLGLTPLTAQSIESLNANRPQ